MTVHPLEPGEASAPTPRGLVGFHGVITYADGRPPESFDGGPALLASWELYALRNGYPVKGEGVPPMLMSLIVAYAAIGGSEGFETWRQSVYGVTLETVDVPPTPEPRSAA